MKSIELLTLEAKFALLNALDPTWIEKLITASEQQQSEQQPVPKRKIVNIDSIIDM